MNSSQQQSNKDRQSLISLSPVAVYRSVKSKLFENPLLFLGVMVPTVAILFALFSVIPLDVFFNADQTQPLMILMILLITGPGMVFLMEIGVLMMLVGSYRLSSTAMRIGRGIFFAGAFIGNSIPPLLA